METLGGVGVHGKSQAGKRALWLPQVPHLLSDPLVPQQPRARVSASLVLKQRHWPTSSLFAKDYYDGKKASGIPGFSY